MANEEVRWRRLMDDICTIKERLARIEGRCGVLLPTLDTTIHSRKEAPIKLLLTHWKFISGLVGFIVLWARSGLPSAVNAEQIKHLNEAVAWMSANW